MSVLGRYLAAISHLGPRQAALNLVHRARRLTRGFCRYRRPGRGLEWRARARTPALHHAGGARLAAGTFTAIGRSGAVDDPPRWEAEAPLLWLYNLHYFGWLAALPSADQARLVLDWVERYPAARGRPGWWPYPLSLRLRHWTRALLDPGWGGDARARVVAALEPQADCLADTLEHHLRGNHLLESGITLKLLSACVHGPAVSRWERLADRVLERELGEQFLLDGGHFERSPMYHALLLHGLLDLANLLPEEDEQRVRLVERLPGLLRFLAAMRHPDGEIALFNDAALDIAAPPADLLAYAARLGVAAPEYASGSFPVTGYHVYRRGGDALVVDAGPIGPDYLSTHAHGDLFSYEWSLDGTRVVVDGGTSTYAAGEERAWVRSTRAHNTVELDGADQCEFFGAFRVGRRGRPRDVTARVFEDGLRLSGWHDGYRRLRGGPVHRRELALLSEGALAVWDGVESHGTHRSISRVRFAPGTRIDLLAPGEAVIEAPGVRLSLTSFGGTLTLESDHYAPRFGERHECPVLALVKGDQTEFGYLLARHSLGAWIDSRAAHVAGRAVPRQDGTPGGPGSPR
jgi:uncharacterized heparinase superfamily protein